MNALPALQAGFIGKVNSKEKWLEIVQNVEFRRRTVFFLFFVRFSHLSRGQKEWPGEVKGQRHEGEELRRKEQQSSVTLSMACWSA